MLAVLEDDARKEFLRRRRQQCPGCNKRVTQLAKSATAEPEASDEVTGALTEECCGTGCSTAVCAECLMCGGGDGLTCRNDSGDGKDHPSPTGINTTTAANVTQQEPMSYDLTGNTVRVMATSSPTEDTGTGVGGSMLDGAVAEELAEERERQEEIQRQTALLRRQHKERQQKRVKQRQCHAEQRHASDEAKQARSREHEDDVRVIKTIQRKWRGGAAARAQRAAGKRAQAARIAEARRQVRVVKYERKQATQVIQRKWRAHAAKKSQATRVIQREWRAHTAAAAATKQAADARKRHQKQQAHQAWVRSASARRHGVMMREL